MWNGEVNPPGTWVPGERTPISLHHSLVEGSSGLWDRVVKFLELLSCHVILDLVSFQSFR